MSRVLLVDDEPRFSQATGETLRGRGHDVTTANCLAAAREAIRRNEPEIVVLDLVLPDGNGLELLEQFDKEWAGGIVFITGDPSIREHISSLAGPDVAYLTKPVEPDEILSLLDSQLGARHPDERESPLHFGLLVGDSTPMQRVYEEISKFGPTDATVLIEGESGTGKELVARALHRVSRRGGAFVPTNCGALAHDLIASELFGHEKGSFTGATSRHAGMFERASGGTLFLDEISEMPMDMQTYLLRSLETGEILRVGGEKETKTDARVIAATNRRLTETVADGSLRKDLYYRLSECVISLPPLRTRGEDLDRLVDNFIAELNRRYRRSKRASAAFLDQCREYDWPGNIRELQHVVHRAYLLADAVGDEIPGEQGFEQLIGAHGAGAGIEPGRPIRDVERELIYKTLEYYGGDKKAAADSLGICLKTLYNRLNEYENERED
jgi:two-component system response regulator HydG